MVQEEWLKKVAGLGVKPTDAVLLCIDNTGKTQANKAIASVKLDAMEKQIQTNNNQILLHRRSVYKLI